MVEKGNNMECIGNGGPKSGLTAVKGLGRKRQPFDISHQILYKRRSMPTIQGVVQLGVIVTYLVCHTAGANIRVNSSAGDFEWVRARCQIAEQKMSITLDPKDAVNAKATLTITVNPFKALHVTFVDAKERTWTYDVGHQPKGECSLKFLQTVEPQKLAMTLECEDLSWPGWGTSLDLKTENLSCEVSPTEMP